MQDQQVCNLAVSVHGTVVDGGHAVGGHDVGVCSLEGLEGILEGGRCIVYVCGRI